MLNEDLKEQVHYLSAEDRKELREIVREEEQILSDERGEQLIEMMSGILGERLPVEKRNARYVWARAMIAYQLTTEGFSSTRIGKILGKEHSTVLHLIGKMKDAFQFPQMYWDVMPVWEQFQNKIKDDIQRRSIQNLITI